MKPAVIVVSLATVVGMCQTADQPGTGAKVLYYGLPFDGRVPSGSATRKVSATRTMPTPNTGLKYWVELVQPNSAQILRVNSTRIFHSGERIRLHFETNINGRIALLQLNPDGTSQTLFPDRRINGGDNHILAGADTTVPSATSWFTFDNNPGTERVLVFLTAEPAAVPAKPSGPRAAGIPPKRVPAAEAPIAANAMPGSLDGKLNAESTAVAVAQVEKQRDSKALLLEVDDQSEAPADYAVKPAVAKTGSSSVAASEALAIEIDLKHQ